MGLSLSLNKFDTPSKLEFVFNFKSSLFLQQQQRQNFNKIRRIMANTMPPTIAHVIQEGFVTGLLWGTGMGSGFGGTGVGGTGGGAGAGTSMVEESSAFIYALTPKE